MIAWMPLLALASAIVQAGGATVSGLVRDAHSGEPVAGAIVALTDLDRATASGGDGRYHFREVASGLQHLEVRRIGYASRTFHAFVPASGDVEIHVFLEPDPVSIHGVDVAFPVVVRGNDPEGGPTEVPSIGVSAAAVRNHPLLAEPDFFAALSGGVVSSDPEAPTGLHVRGGGADQVTFLLDGIPVLNPYHSVGVFSAWNPEALARLRLDPAPPGTVAPDALSGVVAAETLRPGPKVRSRGAVSSRQVRLTVDGPVPLLAGGGFLLSARRGFPGFPLPDAEPSYVQGRAADWLGKLEGRLAGGEFRLLGYGNRNRTDTSSGVAGEGAAESPASAGERNRFRWDAESWGGEWSRLIVPGGRLVVRGWSAAAAASGRWHAEAAGPLGLASARRDAGGAAVLEIGDSAAATTVGLRVSRSRTAYRLRPDDGSPPGFLARDGRTEVAALAVDHTRRLGPRVRARVGLVAAVYEGSPRLAPRLEGEWAPSPVVSFTASLARAHQAEQSLANPESVVGHVFPAALFLGASTPGLPLARSDQVIVTTAVRPAAGVRVVAEVYARAMDGLVLVAPASAAPFSVEGFSVGDGSASGGALDVSISRARYALLGSFGVERVRYAHDGGSYVPAFAAARSLAVGALVRPRPATSLRIGLTGLFGRRASALAGPFEWEPCNLLDQGCEFSGSPRVRDGSLGSVRPPAYLRLDLGGRKHWHLRVGRVDTELGIYASLANVLDRRNLLTLSVDPATAGQTWIEMQSRVPLVVGLDWRF